MKKKQYHEFPNQSRKFKLSQEKRLKHKTHTHIGRNQAKTTKINQNKYRDIKKKKEEIPRTKSIWIGERTQVKKLKNTLYEGRYKKLQCFEVSFFKKQQLKYTKR